MLLYNSKLKVYVQTFCIFLDQKLQSDETTFLNIFFWKKKTQCQSVERTNFEKSYQAPLEMYDVKTIYF